MAKRSAVPGMVAAWASRKARSRVTSRCIRVYGRAKAPVERIGVLGPGFYLRIPDAYTWS